MTHEQPEALRLAEIIGGHVADELRRLHDENAEMKELLLEYGIKYPKQQPILFTKMVDFEPR